MYRILTQDKNRHEVLALAKQNFLGFTWYTAHGYWLTMHEGTLIFEVSEDGKDNLADRVLIFATRVKSLNNQQSVLVQKIREHSTFV